MISSNALASWLIDFHLASAALLASSLLTARLLSQPAHRVALAWATCGAIALAGVLYALPGWASIPLVAAQAPAYQSLAVETAEPSNPGGALLTVDLPVPPDARDTARAAVSPLAPQPLGSLTAADFATAVAVAGAACVLAWLAAGCIGASRLIATGRPAESELDALVQQLWGASDAPRLLIHDQVDTPVALNLLRPTVLVPAALAQAPAGSLRPLLAHELTHLRNGDLWLLAMVRALMAVLWVNPLFWLLRRRIRFDQERLADAVAADQTDRYAYAEQLVAWARTGSRAPRVAGAVGLWESRSQLQRRVAALLDTGAAVLSSCGVRWRVASAAGCVAVGVGVSLLTMTPPTLAEDAPTDDARQGEGLTYTGVVVNKETGEPIGGVEVLIRLRTSSQNPWPILEETTHRSGADGKYEFTISPERVADSHLYVEVEATHPDYARKSPSGYALSMIRKNADLGEEPFFSEIRMQPGQQITGVVLRPDGAPAVGVNVLTYSKSNPRDLREYGTFASTETDQQGRFVINVVRGGPAVLWIRPRDLAPETHLLAAAPTDVGEPDGSEDAAGNKKHLRMNGERTDLGTLKLSPGLRLSGQVLGSSGDPMPGVWVNASLQSGPAKKQIEMAVSDSMNRTALTDAQGRFELAPLPAGGYRVMPEERPEENVDRSRKERPLPEPFLPIEFELSEESAGHPLELQAAETVTIRTQNVDSDGMPTRGHGYWLGGFAGQGRKGFFSLHPEPDENGVASVAVPKGLWNLHLQFSTNEHGALRVRRGPGEPLTREPMIDIDRLTEDLGPVEVVRYVAPILMIKPVDENGAPVEDFTCTARYIKKGGLHSGPGSRYFYGGDGDVSFEPQQDRRWRTSQLLPDEPFELTVTAPGYQDVTRRFELSEGETHEATFKLEPRPTE